MYPETSKKLKRPKKKPFSYGLRLCEEKVAILALANEVDSVKKYYPVRPDAIFTFSDGSKVWVEETCAMTYIVKSRIPYATNTTDSESFTLELDCPDLSLAQTKEELVNKILDAIQKKDNKTSYDDIVKKLGQGVLLISLDCRFVDPKQWAKIIKEVSNSVQLRLTNRLSKFKSVYFYIDLPRIKNGPYGPFYSVILIHGERLGTSQSKQTRNTDV